jgi:hypothetical protein
MTSTIYALGSDAADANKEVAAHGGDARPVAKPTHSALGARIGRLVGANGVAICSVVPLSVGREALFARGPLLVAHLPRGLSSGDDLGVHELPINVARVLTVGGLGIAVSRSGHGLHLPGYNQLMPELDITAFDPHVYDVTNTAPASRGGDVYRPGLPRELSDRRGLPAPRSYVCLLGNRGVPAQGLGTRLARLPQHPGSADPAPPALGGVTD